MEGWGLHDLSDGIVSLHGRGFVFPFVGSAQLQLSLAASGEVVPSAVGTLIRGTLLEFGATVPDGIVVSAVSATWALLVDEVLAGRLDLTQVDPRVLEEVVAGCWERSGCDVILTPQSGDGGRDVIATLKGQHRVKFIDQVKRYAPGHLVTADEVRSMVGVLSLELNASKAYVTTTSDFAPGVRIDPRLSTLMPTRLELRNGIELRRLLQQSAREA